jgi:uracil-DNA glycosylase family 4
VSPVTAVPADEIHEKYLQKAISEINELGDEIARAAGGVSVPVLGSGHPLADIFLLKHGPQPSEVQEGVAFFGRAGQAVLKSIDRLRVDPMKLYGTLCVKADAEPTDEDIEHARQWLTREMHIVQPAMIVAMGEPALDFLNGLEFPLSRPISYRPGEIQRWTPSIEVLPVPDIDSSLNEADAKQQFWTAFKVLGEWYENLPPY